MTNVHTPRRFKFIGCNVLYREACYLAATCANTVDVEFLEKGLHDLETLEMAAHIQESVDTADAAGTYEAILLGYARCNDGLVGVTARTRPLVIPRAHDCITLLFGSRQAYRTYFDENPGTYYETTGWLEHAESKEGELDTPAYGMNGVMKNLGLTDTYEQLVEKHGKDNADYILETLGGWEKAYRQLCYIEMGVAGDETPFIELARQRAEEKGWAFEQRKGDLGLLAKLFTGPWDEDVVVVQPGQSIRPRNDESVLDAE
ncbi:MAG: DUF1638 domain-containing protein [Planctomycetes bacterium]|jgi:hypothetical protein|nr:DUF1638 domain-containing protein [Phycisphaerae bacterium]NBB94770.1 DUF1638 domain-containing protein [Planctomycetota bacterium]